jgi:hypothetical protein
MKREFKAPPLSREELHSLLILTDPLASILPQKSPEATNRLRQLVEELQRLRAQHRRYPARITGISHYRVRTNPLEAEFDLRWRKEQEGRPMLAALLADQRTGDGMASWDWYDTPSERDFEVAASVVQWLGTNVGRCFLEEVLRTPAGESFLKVLQR